MVHTENGAPRGSRNDVFRQAADKLSHELQEDYGKVVKALGRRVQRVGVHGSGGWDYGGWIRWLVDNRGDNSNENRGTSTIVNQWFMVIDRG